MPNNDLVITSCTSEDLRAIWDFVRHDFEEFLKLLVWLEDLSVERRTEHLRSARFLRARATADAALQAKAPGASTAPDPGEQAGTGSKEKDCD